jgi:prevent-host-death family protein
LTLGVILAGLLVTSHRPRKPRVAQRAAAARPNKLIDLARLEPVVVEKHGRPVVAVLAVEEFERLRVSANGAASQSKEAKRTAKRRRTERA